MSDACRTTYACFYDFYDGPECRAEQLAFYRHLAAAAGPSVLELGCGTGIVALDLARAEGVRLPCQTNTNRYRKGR